MVFAIFAIVAVVYGIGLVGEGWVGDGRWFVKMMDFEVLLLSRALELEVFLEIPGCWAADAMGD